MNLIRYTFLAFSVLFLGCNPEKGFKSMIFEHGLSGWKKINSAPDTWMVSGNRITGTGNPTSYLRSDQQYENFILEFDLLNTEDNNAALLVHSDALPAPGKPFPRGVKIMLNNQHPMIKPAYGARIMESEGGPVNKKVSGEKGALAEEWFHYRITSNDGEIAVEVNDKPIFKGADAKPRKGYLSLASKGSKVVVRDIRIKELPSSDPAPDFIAMADEGFTSLFDGPKLSAWEVKEGHRGHWTAKDWVIDYDGKSEEKDKSLWSKKEYRDFILIADIRSMREPEMALTPVVLPNGKNKLKEDGTVEQVELPYAGDTGIYLRGSSKNQINIGNRHIGSGEIYGYRVDKKLPAEVRAAVTPKIKADNPPGEWNRFIITMKGERVTVIVNDQLVIDHALLPGISETGRIALQDDHANSNLFQFGNLFIKEL